LCDTHKQSDIALNQQHETLVIAKHFPEQGTKLNGFLHTVSTQFVTAPMTEVSTLGLE
jgi:hypothetical protein